MVEFINNGDVISTKMIEDKKIKFELKSDAGKKVYKALKNGTLEVNVIE